MFNTRYFIIKVGLADSDKRKFNLFITCTVYKRRMETQGAICYQADRVGTLRVIGYVSVKNEIAVDLML